MDFVQNQLATGRKRRGPVAISFLLAPCTHFCEPKTTKKAPQTAGPPDGIVGQTPVEGLYSAIANTREHYQPFEAMRRTYNPKAPPTTSAISSAALRAA